LIEDATSDRSFKRIGWTPLTIRSGDVLSSIGKASGLADVTVEPMRFRKKTKDSEPQTQSSSRAILRQWLRSSRFGLLFARHNDCRLPSTSRGLNFRIGRRNRGPSLIEHSAWRQVEIESHADRAELCRWRLGGRNRSKHLIRLGGIGLRHASCGIICTPEPFFDVFPERTATNGANQRAPGAPLECGLRGPRGTC
jgi:hypothetical protein